jgi:hypothetical protein
MMARIWRLLAGLFLVLALAGCESNYEPSKAVQSHLKAAGFLPYAGKGYYCPKTTCGDELLAIYYRAEVNKLGILEYSAQAEIASRRLGRVELEQKIRNSSELKGIVKNLSIISMNHRSAVISFLGVMPVDGVDYTIKIRARVVHNTLYLSAIAGVDKRLVSRYFTPRMLD